MKCPLTSCMRQGTESRLSPGTRVSDRTHECPGSGHRTLSGESQQSVQTGDTSKYSIAQHSSVLAVPRGLQTDHSHSLATTPHTYTQCQQDRQTPTERKKAAYSQLYRLKSTRSRCGHSLHTCHVRYTTHTPYTRQRGRGGGGRRTS